MRLENIVALTNAHLVSQPSITSVEGIAFEARKVKRGNLFIALDHAGIEEAVLNGAYGVVFQGPTQISDTEIAWIKVASVDEALLRLLRFHLIKKELDVYACDLITLKLAAQLQTGSNFFVMGSSLQDAAYKLWELEPKSIVIYSPEMTAHDLFVSSKNIPLARNVEITIMEQTLFETSFIFDNTYYERQLLSPFFIPYLDRLLAFLKQEKIVFRLRAFTAINHFRPIFTNREFQVKEFGASDRVLIFEPDLSLVMSQIDFLRTGASWAKIIYILPETMTLIESDAPGLFTYRSQHDIIEILKNNDFHFALIAAQEYTLLDQLQQHSKQLTLDL